MIGTFWLALIIIFIVIEIATVALTSIWLAGGALVAFIFYRSRSFVADCSVFCCIGHLNGVYKTICEEIH